MTSCQDCGREWTGISQAHCAGCCQHFSTTGNFDRHQRGGKCVDPAAIERKCGAPWFKQVEHKHGLTWVQTVHEPPCDYCDEAA